MWTENIFFDHGQAPLPPGKYKAYVLYYAGDKEGQEFEVKITLNGVQEIQVWLHRARGRLRIRAIHGS